MIVSLSGYAIYQCDRTHLTSTKSGKGGVMVAVKDSIASYRIISGIHNVEHLLIEIKPCRNSTWLLVSYYTSIPPLQLLGKYNSILLSTEVAVSAGTNFDDVIHHIIGDF